MNFGQEPQVPYYEYKISNDNIWIGMPSASYEVNVYLNYLVKQLCSTENDKEKLHLIIKTSLLRLVSCGVLINRGEVVLDIKRMFELNLVKLI